jgi:hypothetical protein
MDGQGKDARKAPCGRSVLGAALPLSVMVIGMIGAPQPGRADEIKVNLSDPEIQKFAIERATNRPMTLGISQENRINGLKLPVLAFDAVPQLVKNTSPPGLQPTAPTRQVFMNEADPTWYQINDQYGDISISVQASLTVHHEVSKSTIYQPPTPPGLTVDTDPHISVFDENGEPGFQGVIVEYTVYKYPDIPYTVTIECTQQAKEKCRDLAVVAKDKDLLKLIAVPPPK